MTEVAFTMQLDTGISVQLHEFTDRAAGEVFYSRLSESVRAGNTLGATFRSGKTRRSIGTMSAKAPLRFQTVKCCLCHDWQPELMVSEGVCQLCEEGDAKFDCYEHHVAFFYNKKRAEYFCKSIQKKRAVAVANRPVKGMNERGEKSWVVYYATYAGEGSVQVAA
jgi:hypothetical protein